MKIVKFLLIFQLLMTLSISFAGEIALTFDDVPKSGSQLMSGSERTDLLIENLKKVGVKQVMLFALTKSIDENSESRIYSYIRAGHLIANHSYSHFWTDKVSASEYISDISKAHSILKNYQNFVLFYRHPFLDEGKTKETRDAIRAYLAQSGYSNGYVTVDNYDWYMDTLYQKAVREGKTVDYDKLKTIYIEELWDSIQFYDEIAKEELGRSPKHILLLHENDLAAMFIDDLVKFLEEKGWSIISPLEAYKDPISKVIPDTLFNNQGRIAAIAAQNGRRKSELINENEDEEYLDKLFKEQGVFK